MALDATARESNVRDSIKKYLIDSLFSGEQVKITFDKALSVPKIQGHEVTQWVAVQFGTVTKREPFLQYQLDLYCCTRKDPEGYQLAHLRDKAMGYLTDSSQTDGTRRVTFYKTINKPWTEIGKMLVYVDAESGQMLASDQTKFKIISVRLKWGAKI